MQRYSISLSPILPVDGLRRGIDRVLDDVLRTDARTRGSANGQSHGAADEAGFAPAVDIREDGAGFVFELELAGASPDAIELLTEDGVLTIRGEITPRALAEGERQVARERQTGRFFRRFRLPKSADPTSISAEYAHGVLTVRVQKTAPAQPRRVPIAVTEPTNAARSDATA